MKAKFNIGTMTVEVEGLPDEISDLIMQQANQNRVTVAPSNKKIKLKTPKAKKKSRKTTGRKNWTPEEDVKFKEYYNKKKTVKEICGLLGRSERSVYQHIIVLRNKGEIDAL